MNKAGLVLRFIVDQLHPLLMTHRYGIGGENVTAMIQKDAGFGGVGAGKEQVQGRQIIVLIGTNDD
jgi:hypothetical protein